MERGIAEVVDAIFLLLIAAIASAIVLGAASHYGKAFQNQSQTLLMNYYAKQVVRVLVTASVMRGGTTPDYLLSFMKENVEEAKNLKDVQDELNTVISEAMKPIEDRYDYVVAIDASGTSWNYVDVFYKITVGTNNVDRGIKEYQGTNEISAYQNWLNGINTNVYSSATTIFMRYGSSYIPVDIRVIILPKGSISSPS